ncbi:hypothetical protein AWC38_SpisGene20771 [Stylophora pistillata]|uniref:Uncharacterized protein n=1 Tax=Stylophora pistillata TaxID=50429 RepID=A0A2B4RDY2_STYPI|nr:hypothetical protein AWC38_SpisGene20771 [Stylophora pistillata]
MNEALKETDEHLKEKDEEIAQLRGQNDELFQHINKLEERLGEVGCTGKKLGDLCQRQKSRQLKALKSRAEVALWFMKSYGLELSCLKGADAKHGTPYTLHFDSKKSAVPTLTPTSITDEEDEKLEQVLFLLDKFCVSQYPGAQISFSETLIEHVRELLKKDPHYDLNEPVKVKISGDGAKMSKSTNFMILSFCLLQTGEKVMSSKGNRTIAIVNGPEKYETTVNSFRSAIDEINATLEAGSIEPLLNIELDHVILDELHLMMRITDLLLENLMTEVMERDSNGDLRKGRGEKKGVYLESLVEAINNIGIPFSIWEKKNADGKGSGSYDWTSLIGSDKEKLMDFLPA